MPDGHQPVYPHPKISLLCHYFGPMYKVPVSFEEFLSSSNLTTPNRGTHIVPDSSDQLLNIRAPICSNSEPITFRQGVVASLALVLRIAYTVSLINM